MNLLPLLLPLLAITPNPKLPPTLIAVAAPLPDLAAVNPTNPADPRLRVSLTDSRGRRWLGCANFGLFRCEPGSTTPQRVNKETIGAPDDWVSSLAEDAQGRIWVGHARCGVSVFNGHNWENYDLPAGPLGEHIYDLEVNPADRSVWIAHNAGITVYRPELDPAPAAWQHLTRADGLPDVSVRALAFHPDGKTVYAACDTEGLAVLSRLPAEPSAPLKFAVSNLRSTLPDPDLSPKTAGTGLPSNFLNDLLVDTAPDGKTARLLVATEQGLASASLTPKSDPARKLAFNYLRGQDLPLKIDGAERGQRRQDLFNKANAAYDKERAKYDKALATNPKKPPTKPAYPNYDAILKETAPQPLDKKLLALQKKCLLAEDYIERLARADHSLLLNYRRQGVRAHFSDFSPKAVVVDADRQTELRLAALASQHTRPAVNPPETPALPSPRTVTPEIMLARLQNLAQSATPTAQPANKSPATTPASFLGIRLEDDFRTLGNWIGRYGRTCFFQTACDRGNTLRWISVKSYFPDATCAPGYQNSDPSLFVDDPRAPELIPPCIHYFQNALKAEYPWRRISFGINKTAVNGDFYLDNETTKFERFIYIPPEIPTSRISLYFTLAPELLARPDLTPHLVNPDLSFRISVSTCPIIGEIHKYFEYDAYHAAFAADRTSVTTTVMKVDQLEQGVWKTFMTEPGRCLRITIDRNYSDFSLFSILAIDPIPDMHDPYCMTANTLIYDGCVLPVNPDKPSIPLNFTAAAIKLHEKSPILFATTLRHTAADWHALPNHPDSAFAKRIDSFNFYSLRLYDRWENSIAAENAASPREIIQKGNPACYSESEARQFPFMMTKNFYFNNSRTQNFNNNVLKLFQAMAAEPSAFQTTHTETPATNSNPNRKEIVHPNK